MHSSITTHFSAGINLAVALKTSLLGKRCSRFQSQAAASLCHGPASPLLPASFPSQALKMWASLLLFLAALSAVSAQEDLSRKVFLFRNETSEDYIVLKPPPKEPLQNFTICLRSYTDLTRPYGLFSYATHSEGNEILVFKPRPGEYRFFEGGEYVSFRVPDDPLNWEHICFGWESATGTVEFWMNGKPWPRKGLKKGYTVSAEAFILLGQEQDYYGGSGDSFNSFSGELADVYMWDFLLSPYNMRSVYRNLQLPSCTLGWKNLQYEIKGDVTVKTMLR